MAGWAGWGNSFNRGGGWAGCGLWDRKPRGLRDGWLRELCELGEGGVSRVRLCVAGCLGRSGGGARARGRGDAGRRPAGPSTSPTCRRTGRPSARPPPSLVSSPLRPPPCPCQCLACAIPPGPAKHAPRRAADSAGPDVHVSHRSIHLLSWPPPLPPRAVSSLSALARVRVRTPSVTVVMCCQGPRSLSVTDFRCYFRRRQAAPPRPPPGPSHPARQERWAVWGLVRRPSCPLVMPSTRPPTRSGRWSGTHRDTYLIRTCHLSPGHLSELVMPSTRPPTPLPPTSL